MRILPFPVVALALLLSLAGCKSTEDEIPTDPPGPEGTVPLSSPQAPRREDVSGDTTFMSFAGRLRQAVARRDRQMLSSMMTENFGYSMNPVLMGPGVFDYWDQYNLWPELELVVRERWQPLGNYMVTPLEFALEPESYTSSRAGAILVNGSWRFAYFVTGQ